jgi:hypothetical protein
MNEFLDKYCERLGPGLLAEPINAFTNLAFFIAAYFVYRLAREQNNLSASTLALSALIAIIGIGSSLFHTIATFWAMLADSLPILIYQIVFLMLYARHIIKLSPAKCAGLLAAYFATIYGFGQLPGDWLNGSLQYTPALLFIFGLGIWHSHHAARERLILLHTTLIFTISLTFRSFDRVMCDTIPIGTHFVWHILNGTVLYLTARAYILNLKR